MKLSEYITDRRIEMKNELLITYKITEYGHDPDRDGDHGETISYTVSDTQYMRRTGWKDCSDWWTRGWGTPSSMMFELNLVSEALLSLGLQQLKNFEIVRDVRQSESGLENTKQILVRYSK
jgi:hypothetical protein